MLKAVAGSSGGAPSGAAGGVLSGTYPNPGFATGNTPAFSNSATVSKSVDYTTVAADRGSCIAVTTGSGGDVTITLLSAVTAGDGAVQIVQKVDSGTKKVIVSNGADIAWLSNQYDIVEFRSNGTSWTANWYLISPRIDNYAAGSSTWTKPPLSTSHWVGLTGGGGGGGSGARIGAGITGSGGAGGQPGGFTSEFFAASTLAATEPVIVGVGGTGAAAQTTNGTAGITGGVPSISSFGQAAYIISAGRNSATGIAITSGAQGGQLSGASATGTATTSRTGAVAASGGVSGGDGGDGGNNSTGVPSGGTAGGGQNGIGAVSKNGGIPGTFNWGRYANGATQAIGSTKTNPVTGANTTLDFGFSAGASGAGGWSNADGTASAGSNGGTGGGGGGGGGATLDGNASGAGGNGGDGIAKVITWF